VTTPELRGDEPAETVEPDRWEPAPGDE
jgi:hypothetical protein